MKTGSKWIPLVACALTLALLGCKSSNQQSAPPAATNENSVNPANAMQPSANQPAANQPGANQTAGNQQPNTSADQSAPPPAMEPAAPKEESITVPEGTPLSVRLASSISSGTATDGSEFEGTLAAPLRVRGVQVAPRGASVTGRVSSAVSSGRLNRPAELALKLTSLKLANGRSVAISTSTWSQKATSHKKRNAEMIGGGAGVGALIGAIAGRGKGAAIGGLIGGGAGTAGAAVTGKKEIVLPSETLLRFTLTRSFTFTHRAA
jgi:hypothetical protein